jgi:hypothetical protein
VFLESLPLDLVIATPSPAARPPVAQVYVLLADQQPVNHMV